MASSCFIQTPKVRTRELIGTPQSMSALGQKRTLKSSALTKEKPRDKCPGVFFHSISTRTNVCRVGRNSNLDYRNSRDHHRNSMDRHHNHSRKHRNTVREHKRSRNIPDHSSKALKR